MYVPHAHHHIGPTLGGVSVGRGAVGHPLMLVVIKCDFSHSTKKNFSFKIGIQLHVGPDMLHIYNVQVE